MAGPKISASLREKLRNQRKRMSNRVVLEKVKKVRFRALPCGDDYIGLPFHRFFSRSVGERGGGTTSLRTWGLRCPVWDFLDSMRSASREDRKAAFDLVNRSTEYWIPGVVRGDEGEPNSPEIHILPCRATGYEMLLDFMLDEEDGEDITDPVKGRDFRYTRADEDGRTRYRVRMMDPSPIHGDPEMASAILSAGENFSVRDLMFETDWDVLGELYEILTGESIPAEYLDQDFSGARVANLPEGAGDDDASGSDDGDDGADADDADDADADDDDADDDADDAEMYAVGDRICFVVDGDDVAGRITAVEPDGYSVLDDENVEWVGVVDDEVREKLPPKRRTLPKRKPPAPGARTVRDRLKDRADRGVAAGGKGPTKKKAVKRKKAGATDRPTGPKRRGRG